MIDSPSLIQLLTTYHIPAVLAGTFFFGESVVITSAYLAIQLGWPIAEVFLAAFAGTVISDTFWFFLGSFLQKRFSKSEKFQHKREKAGEFFSRLAGTRPFLVLLYIKFLYGSIIAMILYLATRKVSLSTFTLFNSLGALIWLLVIIPIGVFAAKGTPGALSAFDVLKIGALVLLASWIAFHFISAWLTKKIGKNG